jgi:RimJ/RimL family protein N-acetyltransferase
MRGRAEPGWLGCWLGERHWGQGYATEACHAAIDYAFVHQRHERLLFACRVTNPAGRRVIEKCGFQMVAQELASVAGSGAAVAIDRFRIDRSTWESIRAWEPLRVHSHEVERAEWGEQRAELRAPVERI